MDAEFNDIDLEVEATGGYIHIRNQRRNGRKSWTIVQGIPEKFSMNKILKYFKKELNCNGTLVSDPEFGEVIQLQGDKRKEVAEFLFHQGIAEKDAIKVHGA